MAGDMIERQTRQVLEGHHLAEDSANHTHLDSYVMYLDTKELD